MSAAASIKPPPLIVRLLDGEPSRELSREAAMEIVRLRQLEAGYKLAFIAASEELADLYDIGREFRAARHRPAA